MTAAEVLGNPRVLQEIVNRSGADRRTVKGVLAGTSPFGKAWRAVARAAGGAGVVELPEPGARKAKGGASPQHCPACAAKDAELASAKRVRDAWIAASGRIVESLTGDPCLAATVEETERVIRETVDGLRAMAAGGPCRRVVQHGVKAIVISRQTIPPEPVISSTATPAPQPAASKPAPPPQPASARAPRLKMFLQDRDGNETRLQPGTEV